MLLTFEDHPHHIKVCFADVLDWHFSFIGGFYCLDASLVNSYGVGSSVFAVGSLSGLPWIL